MATTLPQQTIDNLVLDAEAFGKFIIGLLSETVVTRTDAQYPTLARLIQDIAAAGGYQPFKTTDELTAARPDVIKQLAKALDTGRVWYWERTSLAGDEPATGTWTLTDLPAFDVEAIPSTDTPHVDSIRERGWYLVGNATIATNMGLPSPAAGFLFVVDHNNALVHQKWLPFNGSDEYSRTSNVSAVFPAFSKLATTSDLADELSAALVPYVKTDDIPELTAKPYEIVTPSTNLYDEKKQQRDLIVGNNGTLQAAMGWSCSDFIPVTEGEYYTISFEAKRQNLAFYSEKGGAGLAAIEFNTSASNPLTVQAPIGAKYLVTNIDSATVVGTRIQVEKGRTATPYTTYGDIYKIDTAYLASTLSHSTLSIDGNAASIRGNISGVPILLELELTRTPSHDVSTVFNFKGDYVDSVLQRALGDDVAPMRMDGTTIGANHGYQKSNVTLANHGKTIADIGSVWLSGGKEYVIVDIVSSSVLSITSRTDNTAFVRAQLLHVSGAANTASFTPTATASAQWHPAIRDRKLSCFVDDVAVDVKLRADYTYTRNVKFLETYSIMKKVDIVEWLIAHSGVNHVDYSAVPAYTVNFGYTFDPECGCTIYFGGVGRKTVALVDQMITQSVPLGTGNGTLYYYIPKTTEFTTGGFTYDFSQPVDIRAKNPTNAIYLTQQRQIAGTNPIDRVVMLNDKVGYATGYLPVFDAEPQARKQNASNRYAEIRNGTLKVYPRLIDSADITQIAAGDAFAAVAYRKYFIRTPLRTCNYVIRSTVGDYLYLDWHNSTDTIDEVELPSDLVGRSFDVIEKTSNVTVLSTFASNTLLVSVLGANNSYLTLKFK